MYRNKLGSLVKHPFTHSLRSGQSRVASNKWWRRTGSNRRPEACKATALPTELRPRNGSSDMPFGIIEALPDTQHTKFKVVGLGRLELPTSRLSGVRSNHLSYRPQIGHRWSSFAVFDTANPQPAGTFYGPSVDVVTQERETKAAAPALYARHKHDLLAPLF